MLQNKQLTFGQRMGEAVDLSQSRSELVRGTYTHLFYAVAAAFVGGYIGARSELILNLFTGWIGWIIAMVALNGIPWIANKVRHDPVKGMIALIANGFVAGLVLGPIIFIISYVMGRPDILMNAGLMTALIFTAVTAFVWTSGRSYSPKKGIMTGMFVSLAGAIALSMFTGWTGGVLGLVISAGVGIFGVLILFYATSDIIYSDDIDSPITGAVMLFAGLFNVFVAMVRILMYFAGGDD